MSWTPDPNADRIAIVLGEGDGRSVVCSAADAAGSVTVDAKLFAAFPSGTRLTGAAERGATRYARTPKGRIALETMAWLTLDTTLH